MVRHAPIHRRSDHSDIAICCGRNVRGSSLSTSVVPLSNQVTTLNHKRFKGFKMFSDGHLVMAAIDPQTKVFADPRAAIKTELEEISANKTIANNEKKKLLRELNEALKSAEPIQFPTNIELVTKYYDKIDATTIAVHDGSDGHPTSSAVRTISE